MKRIIMHWTGGAHQPSGTDREHYHFVIDGTGKVHQGDLPPEANESTAGGYAAHTRGLNTGSIGVAIAAMGGAVESPFIVGRFPITELQLTALAALCADLARRFDIPVGRETILSHAEVQPTLGVVQRGKWDIAWLPGMARPGDPVEVGDALRDMIRSHAGRRTEASPAPAPPQPVLSPAPAPNAATRAPWWRFRAW